MKVVLIDNYDSFAYNLVHVLRQLGADVTVYRNDQFTLSQLDPFDKVLLSPGPGIPSEAGLLLQTIDACKGRKPILGVCLGEQAIGEYFGARLINLPEVFHGVATPCQMLRDDYLFNDMPTQFTVGRYHSWVVDREGLPDSLEVTAVSPEGYVMALRHRDYDIRGVQFHPESVLTPDGQQILYNWLRHA